MGYIVVFSVNVTCHKATRVNMKQVPVTEASNPQPSNKCAPKKNPQTKGPTVVFSVSVTYHNSERVNMKQVPVTKACNIVSAINIH